MSFPYFHPIDTEQFDFTQPGFYRECDWPGCWFPALWMFRKGGELHACCESHRHEMEVQRAA